jgi:hypothetical protein
MDVFCVCARASIFKLRGLSCSQVELPRSHTRMWTSSTKENGLRQSRSWEGYMLSIRVCGCLSLTWINPACSVLKCAYEQPTSIKRTEMASPGTHTYHQETLVSAGGACAMRCVRRTHPVCRSSEIAKRSLDNATEQI